MTIQPSAGFQIVDNASAYAMAPRAKVSMPELLDSASEASAQATRKNAAGRLLAVLDAFGPRSRALSLSEISRRSELSLSTTHRLVHELLSWGALERDAERALLHRRAAARTGGARAARA